MNNVSELPKSSMPPALLAIIDGPGWEHGALGQHYYSDEEWADVEVYPCEGGGWDYVVTTHPVSELSGAELERLYGTSVQMVRHEVRGVEGGCGCGSF